MKNIIKIYSQKSKLELIQQKKENSTRIVRIGESERVVADIIFKEFALPPIILVPGMNTEEKGKMRILKKMNFLKRHPLIFYNIRKLTMKEKDSEFFYFIKKSVSEIRGIIDFCQDKYKCKKVYLIGASLGGIISTIVSAIDERIEKIVLLVSGGDFENITWRGLLRFTLRKDCSRRTCHNLHQIYKKLLKWNLYQDIEKLPRKCFIYDPLLFAPLLGDKKVLMINGLFDLIIPFFSVIELKEKIKNAEIIWYPGTHLSLYYFFPFLKNKIIKFLEN